MSAANCNDHKINITHQSMPTTVAGAWKTYLETVIPKNASKTQVDESRRCFYSGAAFMITAVTHISDGEEDAAMKTLSALHKEVQDYYVEQIGGPEVLAKVEAAIAEAEAAIAQTQPKH